MVCDSPHRHPLVTILPPKEEACRQLQLNLKAPPPADLPKPNHRPGCRCPVNNSRVVVRKARKGGLRDGAGGKEHRMLLSVTLLLLLYNNNIKTISSPSFLYSSPQTHLLLRQLTFNDDPHPLSDVTFLCSARAASTGNSRVRAHKGAHAAHRQSAPAPCS